MAEDIGEESRKGSLKSQFFAAKRRLQQVALEKMGKATSAADDSEFVALKEQFLAFETLLKDTEHHVQKYLDAARSMCFASAELGTRFRGFLVEGEGETNAEVAAAATAFGNGMAVLDEDIRRVLDERILAEVLDPLKARMEELGHLKKRMAERETYRLDFDAYTRNVRSLKEKPNPNPKKLNEKEAKLRHAKEVLEQSTNEVMYEMQMLLDQKRTIVLPQFRTLVRCQKQFFGDANTHLSTIGRIPDVAPPAPRPKPTFSASSKPATFGTGAGAGAAYSGTVGSSEPPAGAGAAAAEPAAAAAAAPSVPFFEKAAAAAPADPSPPADATGAPDAPTDAVLCKCRASFDYEPTNDDELKLAEGDIIDVYVKQDDGWWEGGVGGRRGVFPSNYVEAM